MALKAWSWLWMTTFTNIRRCSWMYDPTMGVRISSQYLCAFRRPPLGIKSLHPYSKDTTEEEIWGDLLEKQCFYMFGDCNNFNLGVHGLTYFFVIETLKKKYFMRGNRMTQGVEIHRRICKPTCKSHFHPHLSGVCFWSASVEWLVHVACFSERSAPLGCI